MESPDILSSSEPNADVKESTTFPQNTENKKNEDDTELRDQVISNFAKPNLPNVNAPERIIICLDLCYDDENSLYRLGDGTTFTPINMLKRVLDFFLHHKIAINRRTEFALLILKDKEPYWVHNFTNYLKDLINAIDFANAEESVSETFDFTNIFKMVRQKVDVPEFKQGDLTPPPYIVRMVVLYGRSNCIPIIPLDDPNLLFLKKQIYFYIDILFSHEEDCALYKCEEVYDALQNLDDGYSYVYEVSRNATRIHDCIAKLLAHPLQRPLQKNTDYAFGTRYIAN